jgi:hypothetical protein
VKSTGIQAWNQSLRASQGFTKSSALLRHIPQSRNAELPMIEPTTVGLTPGTHDKLRRLKEEGYFPEMTDAYRFAIALALAHGVSPTLTGARGTIFNVGTLDPDKLIYSAIKSTSGPLAEPIYSLAERLAEWGVVEMSRMAELGQLSITKLLQEASSLGPPGMNKDA